MSDVIISELELAPSSVAEGQLHHGRRSKLVETPMFDVMLVQERENNGKIMYEETFV